MLIRVIGSKDGKYMFSGGERRKGGGGGLRRVSRLSPGASFRSPLPIAFIVPLDDSAFPFEEPSSVFGTGGDSV